MQNPGLAVTLEMVEKAERLIRPFVPVSPLLEYPALNDVVGRRVLLKHEGFSPIGSFKWRGALNALLARANEGRPRGVVACSAGNHGQGVTYAASVLGVRATIVVPEWVNPNKKAALEAMGADVRVFGTTASECNDEVRRLAARFSLLILDDLSDRAIMSGHGTIALEVLEQAPGAAALVVPIGGGALAVGCGVVVRSLAPAMRMIGVQSEGAPAVHRSWIAGSPVQSPCNTIADGLAVDVPAAEVVAALRLLLDDFVLVSEDAIRDALRLLVTRAHTLSEPSAATPVAALGQVGDDVTDRPIVLVVTGSNVDEQVLAAALAGN